MVGAGVGGRGGRVGVMTSEVEEGGVVQDCEACACDVEEEAGGGEVEEGEDEEDGAEGEGGYCCYVEVFGHCAGTGEAAWDGEFGHVRCWD